MLSNDNENAFAYIKIQKIPLARHLYKIPFAARVVMQYTFCQIKFDMVMVIIQKSPLAMASRAINIQNLPLAR